MRVGKTIRSPDGDRWRVRRRWMDRPFPNLWRTYREWAEQAGEHGNLGAFESLDFGYNAGWAIAVVVGTLLILFVVLPLLGVAIELIGVLAVLGSGLAGRLVLGRPWVVDAVNLDHGERSVEFAVKGWRDSGKAIDDLAAAIAAGSPPPER